MRLSLVFTFLAALVLWTGCKNDSGSTAPYSKRSSQKSNEEAVEFLGSQLPRYQLKAGEITSDFKDATIKSWSYKDGKFDIQLGGNSFKLKEQTPEAQSLGIANSEDGQQINIILENKPVASFNSTSFDFNIPDGQHQMLIFLGKSYNEAIKNPKAAVSRLIEVKNGNIVDDWNIPDPALFFNSPREKYEGDEAKKVLIDFYPVNIRLGEDAKIKLQINGEQYYLYEWAPYFIEGLPFGDNVIGIQLVDLNGEAIAGKVVSHFRKFKMVRGEEPIEPTN